VRFEPYARKEFGGTLLGLTADSDTNLPAVNVYLLSAAQKNSGFSIFARYRDPDGLFWKVYGSTSIRSEIEKGVSPAAIVAGWQPFVEQFKVVRQPFLLY
jgi:hypothetical protein